jgi:hypothetical protein
MLPEFIVVRDYAGSRSACYVIRGQWSLEIEELVDEVE